MSLARIVVRILAAVLGTLARRLAGRPRLPGWSLALELGVETQRAALEVLVTLEPERVRRLAALATRPSPVASQLDAQTTSLGGVPALALAPASGAGTGALLYFHGGGYVLGSPESHRDLVGRLVLASGARAWSLDYRLAPEHPFPAALEDAEAAYRALLADGLEPGRLVLGGDSAGGNLALALLQRLREAGAPLPAAALLLSPWVDLEVTGASFETNARTDYLGRDMARRWSAQYRKSHDARDPLVSPVHMHFAGVPPLLVQAGGAETLVDEIERFVAAARAEDASVEFQVFEGMPHDWHLFAPFLPEGRSALEAAGRFARSRIDAVASGARPA